jgi:hypothetical protein
MLGSVRNHLLDRFGTTDLGTISYNAVKSLLHECKFKPEAFDVYLEWRQLFAQNHGQGEVERLRKCFIQDDCQFLRRRLADWRRFGFRDLDTQLVKSFFDQMNVNDLSLYSVRTLEQVGRVLAAYPGTVVAGSHPN